MPSKYQKIYTFLALMSLGTSAYSYEMPIGIPNANWGSIDPIEAVSPALPSNWNSEVAGFYYVEPSSASSTDSGNTYGYPSRPRKTIPTGVSPGAEIILAGNISTNLSITNLNCTEQSPCWLRGANENSAPVITSKLSISNSKYLFVENLDFNGGSGGPISITGSDTQHISIRNNKIRNRVWTGNTAAIGAVPNLGGSIHDVVIYNNLLHDLGDYTTTADEDFHGINPTLWSRDATTTQYNIWILSNTCYRISGDCVQINAGTWTGSERYLHHIYAGKNVASQNRQGNVWVKQATDVIVSQNVASGMNGGGPGNAGHGFGVQYAKDYVWFIFNEVYDSVFGFRQSDTTDGAGNIYIIGNLFHDIRPASLSSYDPSDSWSQGTAIALWHGNSHRYIIDNTIYNTYDGINAIYSGNVDIFGNIISQIDNDKDSHYFTLEHPARDNLVEIDYNLFADDGGESYYSWWNNTGYSTSLSQIQSISGGRCGHCIALSGFDVAQLFTNVSTSPASRNFTLTPGSEAIAHNTKHPAYDVFKQRYGLDIYVDFNGNPRPSVNPSIGAFEYGIGNFPPSPPTLLQ